MPKTPKDFARQKELPPSISEAHIDLREELDNNIYLLANGDLGVSYEIQGVYDEVLLHSELYSEFTPIIKFVRALVPGIPAHKALGNTIVQVICSQRVVTLKEDLRKIETTQSSSQKVLSHEESRLFAAGMLLRKFYVSVRYTPPKGNALTKMISLFLQLVSHNKTDYQSTLKKEISKNISQYHTELLQKEIESGLKPKRLSSKELINYYNSVLNRGETLPYDLSSTDYISLHEAIINEEAVVEADRIEFAADKNIRCFVWAEFPKRFALGRMRNFMQVLPMKKWDLVWIFGHGKTQLDASFKARQLWFSRGPAHVNKYKEMVSFEENVDNLRPYGLLGLRLLAYDLQDELVSSVLDRAVAWLSCPIILEKQQALHFIVTSLPMNCSINGLTVPGRCRTLRLEAAAGFLPIYDGPSKKYGHRWWLSRTGTPTSWDLFHGSNNRMTIIFGKSGGGKSCLNSQLILEFLARFPEGIVRIVDKRTSYRKLCDIFEGKVIEFSEQRMREKPYSPFAGSNWDSDDVERVCTLLEYAIAQTNPGVTLAGIHSEIIKEALVLAINEYIANKDYAQINHEDSYPHVIWQDVLRYLQIAALNKGFPEDQSEMAVSELRRYTISFSPTGQYGFLFCKHETEETPSSQLKLLVYDLEGIANEKLKTIASQLCFLKIAQDIQRYSLSTPKLIIFEELGVLLAGDSATTQEMSNRFVANIVKTCRKTNSIAIGITNDVEDFEKYPGARSFWAQSTQKIFLPCTPKIVTSLANIHKELTHADLDIISDIKIIPGERSEAYLMSDVINYKGSFCIPLSPQLDALVSTAGPQVELYSDYRRQGLSAVEAVNKMSVTHPFGRGLK